MKHFPPLALLLCLMSCSVSKPLVIEGNITSLTKTECCTLVCIKSDCFTVFTSDSLYIGKWASFTGTKRTDKRINSKRLRH